MQIKSANGEQYGLSANSRPKVDRRVWKWWHGRNTETIDFCAEHQIVSDVEMLPIQKVNEAYERLLNNDVRYRFVIDLASLKAA